MPVIEVTPAPESAHTAAQDIEPADVLLYRVAIQRCHTNVRRLYLPQLAAPRVFTFLVVQRGGCAPLTSPVPADASQNVDFSQALTASARPWPRPFKQ
jgi:hypothetical protein